MKNNSTTSDIVIVLIEDDAIIRESFQFLLNEAEGYNVKAVFADAESALKNVVGLNPDVILLDIQLPGLSGLQALPKLKTLVPDTAIIILSVNELQDTVFEALSKGASGYLTKNTPPQKILEAINEVMLGGGPMSAHIARMVVNSFQRSNESPLTKRETEILEQIANGKTRGKIADEFFIDLETVKSHLKNIYSKLDVHSKADAIKTAKMNKFI
ncbi:DNA-binding response regulator [Taibaiella sp. KBW10]|uniref:response regulator transcription factor n=1 Tax=Taibaiella sp. KBW10 TaxID=2153357 RepID=UPI000F598865|nr:response regulator transcription factor [Taibaiella sp. KBW10]RQO30541.1 DNA-binding response regulator [Taibaiella sp. KBW10]